MPQIYSLLILYMVLFPGSQLYCSESWNPETANSFEIKQDTIDKQKLYNGRTWRNLYLKVVGDQFLFTKDFLPGNVTIDGRLFKGLSLKYDIYNDEILTITDLGMILQLNKEMIDKFRISYNNNDFHFQRIDADSLNSLSGYVNVLYDGKVSLYVKYRKEILPLEVEHKYDLFNQFHRIYVRRDGKIFLVKSKRDFLNILEDKKQEVRSFIRFNRIWVSKKDPESFLKSIEYYDNLKL